MGDVELDGARGRRAVEAVREDVVGGVQIRRHGRRRQGQIAWLQGVFGVVGVEVPFPVRAERSALESVFARPADRERGAVRRAEG